MPDPASSPSSLTRIARQGRRHRAEALVKDHVIVSMGVGLLPLPTVDLIVLTAVQLRMLRRICQLYDVRFRDNLGKSALSAFISALLPVQSTLYLASLLRLLPGSGQLASASAVSLLAGALTHASGMVFIVHFERGGTLLDFSARRMLALGWREFRAGLRLAHQPRTAD